jgi:hypothetical protein
MISIFKEAILAKFSSLVHLCGALDGVKITIQKPFDDIR